MSGPTRSSEQYFFRGLWGWASSAWRKLGIVWNYESPYYEEEADNWGGAASDRTVDFAAVAAGKVTVVSGMSAKFAVDTATFIEFYVVHDGTAYLLSKQAYPTAELTVEFTGRLTLDESDHLRFIYRNAIGGQAYVVTAWGYTMSVS